MQQVLPSGEGIRLYCAAGGNTAILLALPLLQHSASNDVLTPTVAGGSTPVACDCRMLASGLWKLSCGQLLHISLQLPIQQARVVSMSFKV